MTSSTRYQKPDLSRLADRRRFRESFPAVTGAAALTTCEVTLAG